MVITECSRALRRRVAILEPRQAEASLVEQSQPVCGEQESPLGEASACVAIGGLLLKVPVEVLYGPVIGTW